MNDPQHTEIDVTDKQTLEKLYHQKKMSMQTVADECDVTKSKVRYWMEKHGIERRSREEANMIIGGAPEMHTDHHGYEVFKVQVDNEPRTLQHHRLLATLEHSLDDLRGAHVHHINGVPWMNTVDNLEVLPPAKHFKKHNDATEPHEKLAMWAMHETGKYTYKEIGEMINENPSNVGSFIAEIRNEGVGEVCDL